MADEDYFEWSDEDDIICSSKYISSDEDEDILSFLPKAESSSLKVSCVVSGKRVADAHDDFEREMASELSMTVQHLAASFTKNKPQGSSSASARNGEDAEQEKPNCSEFYDDVYFDSDESDTEGVESTSQSSRHKLQKAGRRVMTNDELLYDPTLDDKDQEWVNKQRRSYQVKQRGMKAVGSVQGGKSSSVPPLPRSDAVLNCPACLTKLCMDCQRHSIYHNQYRAMFVFNCVVDVTESLKFPSKNQKKKEFFKSKKKKGKQAQEGEAGEVDKAPEQSEESVASPSIVGLEASTSTLEKGDELYHPVTCKICNTKVAVYDKDEVYHFFNVVTSY